MAEVIRRAILKNEAMSYSLSDKTLIHLPDSSNENIISFGMKPGEEVQLNAPFDKHIYANNTPVINSSGKVFTQEIGKARALNIKEVR